MRAALTFPPAPFLSHAAGEEGGYATTPSPQPPSSPPREAEEEVRVAVAILRLHLATMPRPSDHPSPAARERGWGCERPAALSFTALVGTGFKPAGWVNDGRSGRRLSFIALVGTGFKPVPPSVFLRQGAVATIHELLANIGFNPVPPSVFLRQTWRPPQGPQRGSGAGGAGDPLTQWLRTVRSR